MKYLKTKIYIVICIITVVSLLSISAVCNQCGKTATTMEIMENTDLEASTKGAETITDEEGSTTKTTAKETSGTSAAEATTAEIQAPTISIQVYQGPTYSASDGVCYYRIEAIVTGNPAPDVYFSKDDSGGALGETKCQVNLNSPSESYTLIAKATNSEGYATDSLILTWGCEAETTEETEEATIFEGWDLERITPDMFSSLDKLVLNPPNIGYLVWPSGVNTETIIFGDSISNTLVQGFFGFGDLSGFSGRIIESVSLSMVTYKFWGDPSIEIFGDIEIYLQRRFDIFPLGPEDWFGEVGIERIFAHNQDPLIWSDNNLKNEILARINDGRKINFNIYYQNLDTDWDSQIDGREYQRKDITLTIEFAD